MATETVNVTGTIANDAVTNAKLANMAAGTHKGRAIGAGTGDPQDLTPDQSSAILDTATDPLMRTSDAVAAFDPLGAAAAAQAAAIAAASNPANITQDSTHRFTTDAEKAAWNAVIGGSVFQSVWNATTNSPSLVSSTGTKGHYYIVSVAGSTNLDGITDWKVGDWAIFDGSVWRKVDNTDAVSSVNSLTGAVTLDTSNVADTSNKRYVTDAQLVVIGNTSGTNTGNETTTTTGALINGATSKTTPVDADELPLVDSAASNVLKKLTWANLKATLKTYFDTLYVSISSLGTGIATFLATPSSANLKSAVTDEMVGAGTKLAFGESGVEANYTGTVTFTAGAAPSSTATLKQFYTEVGNHVEFQISLTYATTGTTVTNVSLTFPTEFPTPAIPTGFTGANAKISPMTGRTVTTPTGTAASIVPTLVRNAADNGFDITCLAFTSGSYRSFIFTGSYFTS